VSRSRIRGLWSPRTTFTPYVGIYADYYFNSDDAALLTAPLLLPTQFVQGWSARDASGFSVAAIGGARLSVGTEVGGLASNQYITGTVRGRASIPF
jgi:hypothetical protein